MDTKEIINLGKSDGARPLVVGNDVYEKDLATSRLFRFSRKRYILLNLIHDGHSLEEAANKAGVDPQAAATFRQTPEAGQYLEMRELREIMAREAKDADRWWAESHLLRTGQLAFGKSQIEAWKESGRRVAPVMEGHVTTPKIEINIDPTAVQEAFRRQQAIEAEIVKDSHAA